MRMAGAEFQHGRRRTRVTAEVIATACVLLGMAGCSPDGGDSRQVVGLFGQLGLGPGCFSYPRAISYDPTGSVLVVDKSGRIQRFDAEGEWLASWRVPETAFGKPVGLAVHPDGRVLVADTHYHRVLIYDREGQLAGTFGSEGLGDGAFQLTTDVAVDAEGYLYVSEYYDQNRITKWSADLRFVQAMGEGPVGGVELNRPTGLVIDDEQTLWVADACNHRVVRFSRSGEFLSTFGRMGREPGELRYPYDISLSPEGTLLVCEYGGDRLQWFDKSGRSLGTWGRSGRKPGELSGPWGAVYGPRGRIYVVDSMNSRIQIVQP